MQSAHTITPSKIPLNSEFRASGLNDVDLERDESDSFAQQPFGMTHGADEDGAYAEQVDSSGIQKSSFQPEEAKEEEEYGYGEEEEVKEDDQIIDNAEEELVEVADN